MRIEFKIPKDFLGAANTQKKIKSNFKKFANDFYKKLHAQTKYKKGYSTGATKKSLSYELKQTKDNHNLLIGYKTHYAPYLEYGTKKMSPQSHLLRLAGQKQLKDELTKVVTKGIKQ